MRLTIPTWISLARLLLIVPILFLLISDSPWPALVLVVIALISDWLDGYLARKYDWVSDIGSFVDHFADKMLVHLLLLYFVAVHGVSALAFGLLLTRDFLVLGVRHIAAQRGVELSSMSLGKIKFVGQSVLLILLTVAVALGDWWWGAANIFLWLSVALAIISAVQILFAAKKVF